MKVTETKGVKIPTYELCRQLEEEFWAIPPTHNPYKIRLSQKHCLASTPLVRGRNC